MNVLFQQIQEIGWEIFFICFWVLVILLLAWFAMVVLKKMLHRLELRLLRQSKLSGEPPSETEKRLETITRLVRQAAVIVLWVIITLTILKEIGVNIGPILASAGIVGLAVGFGAQNLVRDFIAEFFFILENQVRVGDVAILEKLKGKNHS